jgi:hypothetical protein
MFEDSHEKGKSCSRKAPRGTQVANIGPIPERRQAHIQNSVILSEVEGSPAIPRNACGKRKR